MSKALKNMHDLAKDLHEVGAMDSITMKVMDNLCLPEARQFSQDDVRKIRNETKMSQPVFATVIGVSASAIAQWERGAKKPGGSSLRLLDIIDRKGVEAVL
jgi:putative transcriptional regulator